MLCHRAVERGVGGKYRCGLFEKLRPASSGFVFHLGKSTVGEKGAQDTRFQYLFPFHPKKK